MKCGEGSRTHKRSQLQRNRSGSTVAAALVLAACLGGGASSSQGYPGGESSLQRPPQPPGRYPPQNPQQQQQQYPPYRGPRGPGQGQGQGPPGPGQGTPPQGPPHHGPGTPGGPGGPSGPAGPGSMYDPRPPSVHSQLQPKDLPMGYGPSTPGREPGWGGDHGGGYYGGQKGPMGGPVDGGYPSPQPQQPQPGADGSGIITRLTNRIWGTEGSGSRLPTSQEWPSASWAGAPGYRGQPPAGRDAGGYGSGQPYQPPKARPDGTPGLLGKVKSALIYKEPGAVEQGPPSFRPKGSSLKSEEALAKGRDGMGLTDLYSPYPQPPMIGPTPEPTGPGVAEVIAVDNSIILVLKPNELARKKKKFKQDGPNRLQVIATFDHCLTAFHATDGKSPCLKTTDLLEQSPHFMLPEAEKKVRFLRSDFKRKMESEGKNMSPEERIAALEANLNHVYNTVAMEGGVHMSSIGPAIESQLDSVPLRAGVDDMTAALAWRGIPLTIFCAGYGNVAMEVLKRGAPRIVGPNGMFSRHLRLVANFFKPDDTMTIIGMFNTVPLIHEGKKTGVTLMQFLRGMMQEDAFTARYNVLLLGSELSDLGLTSGLPSVEERISVGFLKLDEHLLDKLQRYANAYDVVVIGDGDMSYANEILHEVVG